MSSNAKLALERMALERALDLIRDPEHWVQGCEAADEDGNDLDIDDEYAVRFCMVGSVRRAMLDMPAEIRHHTNYMKVLDTLAKFIPREDEKGCQFHAKCDCRCFVPEFNDDERTTHEDVVLTFKRCIHALEEL